LQGKEVKKTEFFGKKEEEKFIEQLKLERLHLEPAKVKLERLQAEQWVGSEIQRIKQEKAKVEQQIQEQQEGTETPQS